MKKLAALVTLLLLATGAQAAVTINEIRIDQTGTDNDEYFELAGMPGELLTGLTYLGIGDGTGGSGVIESVTSLAGYAIPADGYFLAVEADLWSGTLAPLAAADLQLTSNALNFENSDNVTHLLVSGFTGSNNQDLDTNDDGALDITPWTAVLDLIAVIKEENPPTTTEYHYGPPTVGPEGTFVPGHVYRYPNGSGPWNIGPFDPAVGVDTPGSANVPEPGSLALLGLGLLTALRRR